MYNVAVIGCGVIGLTSALEIQKTLGPRAKVVIFSDKFTPNTTGDIAAGLWCPYLLQETPQDKINSWSTTTQNFVLNLWKKGDAKEAGISLLPLTSLSKIEGYSAPIWLNITLGHSLLSPQHIKYYNDRFGEKFIGGFTFMAFTWEGSKLLPFLQKEFLKNGGEIVESHIESFEELDHFDVIVNCTGLNAGKLVPDEAVKPIRGQIRRVQAPWQFECFFAMTRDNNYYIIPNHDSVILGGTQQVGDYNTNINQKDTLMIQENCQKYIPSLKNCEIIEDLAGLRPGRNAVRVELENRDIGGRTLKIVHNYGHGGSGVTLSVGCAVCAAELVKSALENFPFHSKL